jgi:hypothetical protein
MSDQSSSNNRPPQGPGGPGGNNKRRHHFNRNRRRGQNPANKGPNQPTGQNTNNNQQRPQNPNDNRIPLIERIYEKYQNLLEQHLIARRKYHDLFYRADPPQKNKLERHFHSSLKDIRDFESRLNPAEREIFEKRNNGLALDQTYSTLNAAAIEASTQEVSQEPSDPHYMQSQKATSYRDDKEESVGSKDDYEKYKITH